jgi:hypothetical protein
MIPLLLLVTAFFHPAQPTVGDPIVIDFQQPVVLDASPEYDILSTRGSRVVIRTFEPRPFVISGRVGNVVFRNMVVPVRSVLKPRDDLKPAPLKPPRKEPYPRLPFMLIGIAALLAVGAWTAVIILERRAAAAKVVEPPMPADVRFRTKVIALRDDVRAERRWARLADATREYLAAVDSRLGLELTTREVLAQLSGAPAPSPVTAAEGGGAPLSTITTILRQGDLEKFSPWGALPANFAALADRALELAPESVLEEAA